MPSNKRAEPPLIWGMARLAGGAATVIVVAGRTGVVSVSPARLRAARKAATPTAAELAVRRRRLPGGGITQAELAARIGHAGPGAVHQWERGHHRMDVASLAAVARALGVDPLGLLEPGTPVTLAVLRRLAGHTQASAAAAIGVGRTTWGQIEAGQRGLWPEELDRAAAALGVTVTQVISAAGITPDSAPRVESLPVELVERLDD